MKLKRDPRGKMLLLLFLLQASPVFGEELLLGLAYHSTSSLSEKYKAPESSFLPTLTIRATSPWKLLETLELGIASNGTWSQVSGGISGYAYGKSSEKDPASSAQLEVSYHPKFNAQWALHAGVTQFRTKTALYSLPASVLGLCSLARAYLVFNSSEKLSFVFYPEVELSYSQDLVLLSVQAVAGILYRI